MIEFDMTWRNPSEAQNAALAVAMKMKPRHVTEFEAAEFIILAKESLWYTQAKRWKDEPPKNTPRTWQAACQFIFDVVNLEYDESSKMWWNLSRLDSKKVKIGIILLMDLGMMLKQYRQQSLDVVSQGFEIFIDILCGRGWEKRYAAFLKSAQAKLNNLHKGEPNVQAHKSPNQAQE